jgi:hypothetical protein
MWTIDPMDGLQFLSGEDPETSGDSETEQTGWTSCETCTTAIPKSWQGKHACLKPSSHPTPQTQSTQPDAPREFKTPWERYWEAKTAEEETRALDSLLDAGLIALPHSETSSSPLETGDSEISASEWRLETVPIPSLPSSTTTSIPNPESGGTLEGCFWEKAQDCDLDNCAKPGHSLVSLGLTRACECEGRYWVHVCIKGKFVYCESSECVWLIGYEWLENYMSSVPSYVRWLDENT